MNNQRSTLPNRKRPSIYVYNLSVPIQKGLFTLLNNGNNRGVYFLFGSVLIYKLPHQDSLKSVAAYSYALVPFQGYLLLIAVSKRLNEKYL